MVEIETINKPQAGAYENIDTSAERKPKITWEKIKETHTVIFTEEKPREYPSSDGTGVFYIFDVLENDEEKVILTSSWTLLKGIRLLGELKGKRAMITKQMKNGKQYFEVIDIDKPIEEKVEA